MPGTFCPCSSSVREENESGRYSIEGSNLEFKVLYSFSDIPNTIGQPKSLFVGQVYQQLLEDIPSQGVESIYIPVYEDGVMIGIIMAQSSFVKAHEAFRLDSNLGRFSRMSRTLFLKSLKIRSFVVGNLLLTGNYGIQFNGKSTRESFVILDVITKNAIPIVEKQKGYRFSLQFYKDFNTEDSAQSSALQQAGYHCLSGDPSMIMEIPQEWNEFDDYLKAMSSKYRVRAKRAFKKGKDIQREELDEERILFYSEKIEILYQKVAQAADMNLVNLSGSYFSELKKRLGDNFRMIGYFHDGEMIAFCTTIRDHEETHAHFLGMDNSYNSRYQLYLNILYDIIRIAIEEGNNLVDFARTAPEIKSSVGAVPEDLYVFVKHRNRLLNNLVNPVFKYLEPRKEIVYRNPFKNKTANSKTSKDGQSAPTQSSSQGIN